MQFASLVIETYIYITYGLVADTNYGNREITQYINCYYQTCMLVQLLANVDPEPSSDRTVKCYTLYPSAEADLTLVGYGHFLQPVHIGPTYSST